MSTTHMAAPAAAQGRAETRRSPITTRIIQAALREDCSVADLVELARSDPGFTMRVLGLANSAALGLPRRVEDLAQGSALLGVNGLRNLALSLAVTDMVPRGAAGLPVLANCLRRAIAARQLAQASRRVEPGSAFTVGLLLDAGLLLTAADDGAATSELAAVPATQRVVEERLRGRTAHPELGATLGGEFGLPDTMIHAISHHHSDEAPGESIAQVAWAAEHVASVFEGGDAQANIARAREAARLLGIEDAAFDALLEGIPAAVREASLAFERDVGPQEDLETLRADAARSLAALNLQYEHMVRSLERTLARNEQLMVELREANSNLEELASTDSLTGLPNKRSLVEALRRDLARAAREGTPLALLVLDVDHFKHVNDTHGHAVGDAVLANLGDVLRRGVRLGDVPGRFGGEEFVVVLPNTGAEGAMVVAERLRSAVEAMRTPIEGGVLNVTASIGVAVAREGDTDGALFQRSDEALYAAKHGGRNRCVAAD